MKTALCVALLSGVTLALAEPPPEIKLTLDAKTPFDAEPDLLFDEDVLSFSKIDVPILREKKRRYGDKGFVAPSGKRHYWFLDFPGPGYREMLKQSDEPE